MSRLIQTKDLAHLRENELLALYRAIASELAQSAPHTTAHRYALASLENIRTAINIRRAQALRNMPRP